MRLIVIGYYDRNNFGDEQYKDSFRELLLRYLKVDEEVSLRFVSSDNVHSETVEPSDVVILGGGDILNSYFIDKIRDRFLNAPNKIIAVSVGLPYVDYLVDNSNLDIISTFFVRSVQDVPLFVEHFGRSRVMYLPDISRLLVPRVLNECTVPRPGRRRVCITLSRHFFNEMYPEHYDRVVIQLAAFLKHIIVHYKYHLLFVPFNVGFPQENDTIIHSHVIRALEDTCGVDDSNFSVPRVSNYKEAFDVIRSVDLCICSRFHACLFSVYANVPFLALHSTRKVQNLMYDISWDYYVQTKTNSALVPIDIYPEKLRLTFHKLHSNRHAARDDLERINAFLHRSIELSGRAVVDNIFPDFGSQGQSVMNRIQMIAQTVSDYISQCGYSSLAHVDDPVVKETAVKIVSYKLTNGSTDSVYNWGLYTKMFTLDYDYKTEWKWIIDDTYKSNTRLANNPRGLFNLGYMDQNDYSGVHRSGWQYVYTHVRKLHNENSGVIFDMYLDKTFHWASETCKVLGLIPYKRYWIGVIHHTFDTTFSDYNCENLFTSELFIKSLKYCRGLIVLSRDLKGKVEQRLCDIGYPHVCVHAFVHPTETNVEQWTPAKFKANTDKKIVHIGGWLRNVYWYYTQSTPDIKVAYHALDIPKKVGIKKVVLRGKENNNYFPLPDFQNRLYNALLYDTPQPLTLTPGEPRETQKLVSCNNNNTSQRLILNNWYRHFYDDTLSRVHSVEFIDYLDNAGFDKLLSCNVVCIYLVDASAVNTLVECIVRNTPIIINKLPAVVELLGERYPLYIQDDDLQKTLLMQGPRAIVKAHNYLKKLDKKIFEIEHFMKQLESICASI
ncbi:MAG: hypothetical protein EBU90_01970 [Proteobacteria bacterium]|nr:hypothetical protein [Pseudomonadota bacterium]NBP13248.1 hypothetical protein [bacterium]